MRLLIMLLPWLELFTLVQLGIETSALTVLLYVLATLVLGGLILRRQGMQMFERMRALQQGGVLGPQLLVDDMAMGLAAVLLMFPGMLTDVAAVVVMIGPLRRRLAGALGGPAVEPYAPARDVESETIIEGQYTRLDERDIN
ncbi:FxsA family protein [Pseudohalioglobus sediminis]|uniref:FxsA family protein n=1 Tax=Pseudohalioglobus sediminis TaxID=2606449 RepID=A0A5B0X8M8_9GAMM|nr:FxsA family protein [Pseudohalioglobus sediminis]KAA1194519.1 FxsA family protein [Pseudohalioglobus sediminis]